MRVAAVAVLCMLLAGCMLPDQADATEPQPSNTTYQPPFLPRGALPCNETVISAMQFDVGPGVPTGYLDVIRCGLSAGQDFLDRELGGGIPEDVLANITVKVVWDGNGNQETGGMGSCCTAFSENTDPPGGARPFFDVALARDELTAIHEFVHGWQNTLGCIDLYSQPLGVWMNEGIAHYVAYAAIIDNGLFAKEKVVAFVKASAIDYGEWEVPLENQFERGSLLWPGNIGYIALEFAMNLDSAPYGLMSLRVICEKVADGATGEEAFQTTFGISLDAFYAQFEAWKDANTP